MGIGRFFTGVLAGIIILTSTLAKELPTNQKNREMIGDRPKIQIWVPDPVDVKFGNAKHKKNNGGDDKHGSSRLINSSGNGKKKTPKLTINENAPKVDKVTSNPPDETNNDSPVSPPVTQTDSTGGSEAFENWYPVCMFIDESLESAPNAAVKGLADAGAKCKVNVVVFPVTISGGYPGDGPGTHNIVNGAARSWCNIADAGVGATIASATTCVRHKTTDDYMCGWNGQSNPEISSGCAELRAGQTAQIEAHRQRLVQQRIDTSELTRNHSGGGGGDGVLASIIENGACDKKTVNHEAIAHSANGWPNKVKYEAGFGSEDITGVGGGSDDNWSPAACARLRKVAMPNDGRWRYDAKRTQYYVPSNEPINLLSTGKLFGPPSPPSSPPKIIVNNGAPVEEVFDSNFFEIKPDDSPLTDVGRASGPEKHKKTRAGSSGFDEDAAGKQVASRSSDIKTGAAVPTPTNPARKSSTQTLTMDEGTSKNGSKDEALNSNSGAVAGLDGDDDTSTAQSQERSPETPRIETDNGRRASRSGASIGFDESAKEGGTSPDNERTRVLRRKGTDELDPNFFNRKKKGSSAKQREKGTSLRQPGERSQ